MPDRPLVSILTAVYNGEQFLSETISAVLTQDYPHWEYWIVNDGSTDATARIALQASLSDSRIQCIQHSGGANRGLCASRNLALSHARGKYIAILDADDVWCPAKLNEQVSIAQQFPNAGMVYGRSEYWYSWSGDPQDEAKDHIPPLAPGDCLYEPPELLRLTYPLGQFGAPCPSDLLIQKELLSSLGGFEESFDRFQSQYEDIAFLTKLYLAAPVYVSNRCWDRYRIHAGSLWATGERTGVAELGRRAYFEWAQSYFRARGLTSDEIWRLWRNQSLRYKYPGVDFLFRVGRRLRRSFANE